MSARLTFEDFVKSAISVHGGRYRYNISDYVDSHTKTKIECLRHGVFLQAPRKHIRSKQGCPKCFKASNGKKRRLSLQDFIIKARKVHGNKYNYDNSKYINARTKINVTCLVHGKFTIKANSHLQGCGCPDCASLKIIKVNTKTIGFILRKFKACHGDTYDYSLVDYKRMRDKVKIICKRHGIFEQAPDNHSNGHGCPTCNQSKGEKLIENFLCRKGINYVRQKKFSACIYKRKLPFDFYLPSYQMCIEFDGMLHYYPNYGVESLKETMRNDRLKDKFCSNNGIHLLRIPYIYKETEIRGILDQAIQLRGSHKK